MNRRTAVCLAVIGLTPPAAAAVASVFCLPRGHLFPALPAMAAAVFVNAVAVRMSGVPARYEDAADFAAMGYGIGGTFAYAAITLEIAARV